MTTTEIMALAHMYRNATEIAEPRKALRTAIEALVRDAERWQWWAEAVANHDMNSLEEAFKDIPHDRPTSKQVLDQAIDAAIAAQKEST